jgi:hypothetical protein
VSAGSDAAPEGRLGSRLVAGDPRFRGGLDVKWTPGANDVLDFTVKPDFSQIESDTAQISANERFALFFPEKRTFFLEGVDLLSTSIQAAYTRTITAPRWGSRLTGSTGPTRYTMLVADDAGGGTVVIPGSDASQFVPQVSGSYVVIGRVKRDIGRSFVSALVTDRESHDGAGHNRVAGPDFQWRPTTAATITGQLLFSDTRTTESFSSHAAHIDLNHRTQHLDFNLAYKDFGDGFRADAGFVPQVGYRKHSENVGWTVRPESGFVRQVRTFVNNERQVDRDGALIARSTAPGVNADVQWSGNLELKYIDDRTRSRGTPIGRRQVGYKARFSPSRRIAQVSVDGTLGQDIDFANARPANGGTTNISARVNATDHLELNVVQNRQQLHVGRAAVDRGRLFTANVSRVRGTYMFTSRMFARLIAQYVSTTRNPDLYLLPVTSRSATFSGSALFAYKLNWQSVLFVGYGDDRELSELNQLEPAGRQFFMKVSYAFQR